jgi:hypothetical protein
MGCAALLLRRVREEEGSDRATSAGVRRVLRGEGASTADCCGVESMHRERSRRRRPGCKRHENGGYEISQKRVPKESRLDNL